VRLPPVIEMVLYITSLIGFPLNGGELLPPFPSKIVNVFPLNLYIFFSSPPLFLWGFFGDPFSYPKCFFFPRVNRYDFFSPHLSKSIFPLVPSLKPFYSFPPLESPGIPPPPSNAESGPSCFFSRRPPLAARRTAVTILFSHTCRFARQRCGFSPLSSVAVATHEFFLMLIPPPVRE